MDNYNYTTLHHNYYDRYTTTIYKYYQYVPHKAVAEVAKIAHYRRLVAVNHASQGKSTDGSKSGWRHCA